MDLNTVVLILAMLFIHWVADFIMQDEVWALNKSKSMDALLMHTVTYTLVWMFAGFCLCLFHLDDAARIMDNLLWFCGVTFICHTATDYVTSRKVSKLFAAQKYGSHIPNIGGFSVIGFDQWLHYAQIFLTYYYLTNF